MLRTAIIWLICSIWLAVVSLGNRWVEFGVDVDGVASVIDGAVAF